MAVLFPSLTPSSRTFNAPKWPTNATTSQSGVITRRLWGSKPSQASMSLAFNNISDDNAALIVAAYHAAQGPTTEVLLPSAVLSGISAALQSGISQVTTNSGLHWFFAEDNGPSIESTAPGRCNVQVDLIAELRVP